MKPGLPVHNLLIGDSPRLPLQVIPLAKEAPYDSSIPHRHNYYEIFLFAKGGGTHFIDFMHHPIQSHSIHFVSPGQVHKVSRENGSYGYVILFTSEFYHLNMQNDSLLEEMPFLHNNSNRPILEMNEEAFAPFMEVVDNLQKEYEVYGIMQPEILRSYLNILLIRCKRLFELKTPGTTAKNSLFENFRLLMEKNFYQWHHPSEYAGELAVSEKNLNDICRRHTGKSVSRYIQERIALEAKRLLLHSNLSNKEIGYALHFEDPSYFTKFFTRLTGMSPSDFREESRKNYQFSHAVD
jgi:AraC-like DNA-binding protein